MAAQEAGNPVIISKKSGKIKTTLNRSILIYSSNNYIFTYTIGIMEAFSVAKNVAKSASTVSTIATVVAMVFPAFGFVAKAAAVVAACAISVAGVCAIEIVNSRGLEKNMYGKWY